MLGHLIVRFQSYKSADTHKADLAAALAQASGAWKWVDRKNAAALYPTDFALLEVADAVSDNIKVSCWLESLCRSQAYVYDTIQTCLEQSDVCTAESSEPMAWSQGCTSRAASETFLDVGQQQ